MTDKSKLLVVINLPEATNVFAHFKKPDDLKKLVERYERGLTLWRNETRLKIEKVTSSLVDHVAIEPGTAAVLVSDMLHKLELATSALTTPLEEEPEHQATFKRMRFGSGAAGKFFRKHLDRAEEIRMLNYDVVLTWRSELLGLKRALAQNS